MAQELQHLNQPLNPPLGTTTFEAQNPKVV
jgi:hypothetical protein